MLRVGLRLRTSGFGGDVTRLLLQGGPRLDADVGQVLALGERSHRSRWGMSLVVECGYLSSPQLVILLARSKGPSLTEMRV